MILIYFLLGVLIGVVVTLFLLWLWVLENEPEVREDRRSSGEVFIEEHRK